MNLKDINIKCENDYDFWYRWLGILPNISEIEALPDVLRKMYALGLASPQEEPFTGAGLKHVINEMNIMCESNLSYYTVCNYKYRMKKKGWLTPKGKLPTFLSKMRKDYIKQGTPRIEDGKMYKGTKNVMFFFKLYTDVD